MSTVMSIKLLFCLPQLSLGCCSSSLSMNKLNLEMICSFQLYNLLSLFLLFFVPTIFSGTLFLFNPLFVISLLNMQSSTILDALYVVEGKEKVSISVDCSMSLFSVVMFDILFCLLRSCFYGP